jgi:predicted DNA-binding transcriptional regulator YafY
VSSIEDLKVCEEKMTRRPDFDLRTYWQEARRHIEEQMQPLVLKLRVLPSALSALRGDYTVLSEEQDGGVIVHVNMESLEEAASYVLALGSDAWVLSPKQVREKIAATAQAIAAMYGSSYF